MEENDKNNGDQAVFGIGHNLILKSYPSVFHFSCQSHQGYAVVAMLIPQSNCIRSDWHCGGVG